MKIHRFITNLFDISDSEISIKDREIFSQLKRVLRAKPGFIFSLSDGEGNEWEVSLVEFKQNSLTVSILSQKQSSFANIFPVHLYCSILKKENFELVVGKSGEIGVSRLIPIISSRTVKTGLKQDRLIKISREASELSGRSRVMDIGDPLDFFSALTVASGHFSDSIIFHTKATSSFNSLALVRDIHNPLSIFIGPEGGFSEEEIKLAKSLKIKSASLSSLTFRSETAAIIASYLAVKTTDQS